ncbi:hypothetical protein AKO1_008066 [Acrasis kona]|uniref:L-rhamnose mutarotase n=1 Tax=Acrasis kona TaxID=1008807 RepID=A0AAW2YPB7_9EUKA
MDTISFRMNLLPGNREEYKRRHDEIWPELATALKEAGIQDYYIFLDEGTDHLFAFLKRSKEHKMDDLPNLPIMKKWWAYMSDIMETLPNNEPFQQPLKQVFHFP